MRWWWHFKVSGSLALVAIELWEELFLYCLLIQIILLEIFNMVVLLRIT